MKLVIALLNLDSVLFTIFKWRIMIRLTARGMYRSSNSLRLLYYIVKNTLLVGKLTSQVCCIKVDFNGKSLSSEQGKKTTKTQFMVIQLQLHHIEKCLRMRKLWKFCQLEGNIGQILTKIHKYAFSFLFFIVWKVSFIFCRKRTSACLVI